MYTNMYLGAQRRNTACTLSPNESADPNDDENGYDGDYNTADTDKEMDEEEEKEEAAAEEKDGDDEEDDSFLQAKASKLIVSIAQAKQTCCYMSV